MSIFREAATPKLDRFVILLLGLSYVLPGLALLLAPRWFFAHIGPFAPFNRHYQGDVGAFILPLGVALLFAAWQPARYRTLLGFAAASSLLHALNHAYDAAVGPSSRAWVTDVLPLLGDALLFLLVYVRATIAAKGAHTA